MFRKKRPVLTASHCSTMEMLRVAIEVLIGKRVQVSSIPKPTRHVNGEVRIVSHQLPMLVRDEVSANGLAVARVVRAPGELDQPTSFEAGSVAGLCVAQVRTAFICFTVGKFFIVAQLSALVTNLGKEMGSAQGR